MSTDPELAAGVRPSIEKQGRFTSLRSRLVLTSLILTFALVAVSFGINWALLRNVAQAQTEAALESVTILLAHSTAAGLDFDSKESVREALSGVFQLDDVVFAGVTTVDGALYQSLGEWPADLGRGGVPGQIEIENRPGLLVAHTPIRSMASEVIGVLHLGFSTAEMQRTLSRGLLLLLWAGAGLALTAWLMTRRIGQRLTAPILELASAASSLAEGRFTRIPVSGRRDEIEVVATAFNDMAARLEDSRHKIERHNQGLEAEVRIRTAELRQKNLALAIQNEQVIEVSRLKSAFLANVSHELRTPLNAILALSELIRDEISGPLSSDEQRRQIEMIHQSGQNLLRLINDVLDLSKVEAGKMEIRYERIEVQDVLQAAANEMEPLAAGKKLRFHFSSDGSGEVWVDPDRIRQVFVNLLGNAIKFTERGFVEVSSHLDLASEQLILKVRDSGLGIAPEDQEKIFQEFRQIDGSATRKFGGTGLGLAICRRLTQLMGGDIHVESHPGRGSVFTVTLPAHREEPEAREPVPHEPPANLTTPSDPLPEPEGGVRLGAVHEGSRGLVLVVEDDETVLEALVRYLGREGFDVQVANDGFEALQRLEQDRPDLMLLDLMLPGMSGFQVLEKLTQGGGRPMVPVVVHTAKDLSAMEWDALDRCVERVFRKGQGGVRLMVEEIHRLVERRRNHAAENDAPSVDAGPAANPESDRAAA